MARFLKMMIMCTMIRKNNHIIKIISTTLIRRHHVSQQTAWLEISTGSWSKKALSPTILYFTFSGEVGFWSMHLRLRIEGEMVRNHFDHFRRLCFVKVGNHDNKWRQLDDKSATKNVWNRSINQRHKCLEPATTESNHSEKDQLKKHEKHHQSNSQRKLIWKTTIKHRSPMTSQPQKKNSRKRYYTQFIKCCISG